ncbi:hypothetical protein DL240_18285 [Lujinxingia litoralis]|uniref:3-phosphoshikimate 1-carboxyvinyltransferase n=1 Tax=Lujinxingia litoralis TaxID=2211119 RepID=A0A328C303_9DELT|nr:hypothetical protein [Lujinxingia litoralis]RAL20167.1 hypothetical protein DL240_18285 [Lujinxingia litoralis]
MLPTLDVLPRLRDLALPADAVVVADANLPEPILSTLPDPIIVECGESLKTLARLGELAEEVLARRSTRPMVLVGVGGGSLGDAVGFLASILWRGVDLWHVPSTLLAMVDSAHGGKTALNLGGKKNQLGTFYPARRVVICRELLASLPLDQREAGLVEALKALWLDGAPALAHFDRDDERHAILTAAVDVCARPLDEVIEQAVALKLRIVAEDPREQRGIRTFLNLGHTAGHGLEGLYGLPHGRAVAWGMAACALLSLRDMGLERAQAHRLLSHLDPLLCPLPFPPSDAERQAFVARLKADKKRRHGQLISIGLRGPGQPQLTTDWSADDWWEALLQAHDLWRGRELTLRRGPASGHSPRLPVDKSRAQRLAVIAALRPGAVTLASENDTPPDDVRLTARALHALGQPSHAELELYLGEGATGGRFALAAAAARPAPTRLRFAPSLQARPHQPLIDALVTAGAHIEATDDGYDIRGWTTPPERLRVAAAPSSQYASALALLAASGHSFVLERTGEKPWPSQTYFELTLSCLRQAGVQVEVLSATEHRFSPGPTLCEALRLDLPRDASAAVVWLALHHLPGDIAPPEPAADDHPDACFEELARRLTRSTPGTILEVDLTNAPDLAPVLAALAARLPVGVRIQGAGHLRHKESNRIDALADSLRALGIDIHPTPEGFDVPAEVQAVDADACFETHGDHRLAMCALALTGERPVRLNQAGCVTKSYPDLWRQARRTGIITSASFALDTML